MTDWCTGPCTAAHPAPENGDCQICADAVSLYETDSGKIFDPNGPLGLPEADPAPDEDQPQQ